VTEPPAKVTVPWFPWVTAETVTYRFDVGVVGHHVDGDRVSSLVVPSRVWPLGIVDLGDVKLSSGWSCRPITIVSGHLDLVDVVSIGISGAS